MSALNDAIATVNDNGNLKELKKQPRKGKCKYANNHMTIILLASKANF